MLNSNITTLDRLLEEDLPGLVLVSGVYDLIHKGHIALLQHALAKANDIGPAWLGGTVVVGLNSDWAVRELKGQIRPINTFEDRAEVMAAIKFVDYVFEIHSVRVDRVIRLLKPKAWLKGGDYTLDTLDPGEVAAAKEVGAEIVIFPTVKGYSTTNILKRL